MCGSTEKFKADGWVELREVYLDGGGDFVDYADGSSYECSQADPAEQSVQCCACGFCGCRTEFEER